MKKELVLKTKILPCLFFVMIATIIMFAPYQSDSTLRLSQIREMLRYLTYVLIALSVLFLAPNLKKSDLKKSSFLAMVPAVLLVLLNAFHNYGDMNLGGLVAILWVLFCLFPPDMKRQTFKIFRTVWCLVCLVGLVCFICYVLKLPLPYEEVSYYFGDSNMKYIDYGISFLYRYNDIFRLCGICNEPGYFGTFCALFLCADGLKLRKKSNILILTAGFFSFSLAFVMIVLVYVMVRFVLTAHKEGNIKRKILRYGLAILILFGYFVIAPTVHTGNPAIDKTIERMALTSEGLSGDDRTSKEFDTFYNAMSPTDLAFGMGEGYLSGSGLVNNSSYKTKIVEYGILGCILLWGSLLLAALYKNTKNMMVVIFVIMFFLSIYQRPNVITLAYAILLFGGIEYIKANFSQEGEKYESS